jgi:hypothetical protein
VYWVNLCDDPMAALLGLAALSGSIASMRAEGALAFQHVATAS